MQLEYVKSIRDAFNNIRASEMQLVYNIRASEMQLGYDIYKSIRDVIGI